MKKTSKILTLFLALAAFGPLMLLSSCNKGDNINPVTALVTYQDDESGVLLQLDDNTSLRPTNLKPGLCDYKTVRALVSFAMDNTETEKNAVKVFAVDTIRTKASSPDMGELNDSFYGKDKLEIVKDWVTIGEDGYLTLNVCTHRGSPSAVHSVYLVRKNVEDGKYEFELRHNADGDIYGIETNGLIAFNLNELAPEDHSPITLHLSWEGFYEKRSADFRLTFRKL